jgi:hypothetical protein
MNDHANLPKTPDSETSGGATIDAARIQSAALVLIAFAVALFLLVQARFLLISLATAIVLFSLTSNAINFIARQKIGKLWVPSPSSRRFCLPSPRSCLRRSTRFC